MHAVLASDADDPAFAPEDASPGVAGAPRRDDGRARSTHVFLRLPDDRGARPDRRPRRRDARPAARGSPRVGSVGRRIRHHGDLHLGQVLWAGDDWLVIDFEGEPARPLAERRAKRSPLRDVAGMLRSFNYAAAVAGVARRPTVEERARAEFLAGLRRRDRRRAACSPAPEATERLLRIFELEKAVYELRYELANRPDWVHVPVGGILRLLEAAA